MIEFADDLWTPEAFLTALFALGKSPGVSSMFRRHGDLPAHLAKELADELRADGKLILDYYAGRLIKSRFVVADAAAGTYRWEHFERDPALKIHAEDLEDVLRRRTP